MLGAAGVGYLHKVQINGSRAYLKEVQDAQRELLGICIEANLAKRKDDSSDEQRHELDQKE